jgi:DNA-binding LacI/PurR family transcriptional regulator
VATMTDVARLAGVSVSTVSYAMTGARPITAQTRQRVEDAMEQLGYTPNAFARGLKSRRSHIVAVLFPTGGRGIDTSGMAYILGASDYAQEHGYHLLLWTANAGALDELRLLARQGLIDGAILMEVRLADERTDVLAQAGVEFGMIGHNGGDVASDFVDADFDQCGRVAVNYLADLGHTQIAFINQSRSFVAAGVGPSVRARDAVVRAAKDAGIRLTVRNCASSAAAGQRLFRDLVHHNGDLTAMIALNEQAVPGVMTAARQHGWRVPQDFSLVSLAMTPQAALMTTPATTTVSPDADGMGRAAMAALIHRLDGGIGRATQTLFPGRLVVRGTSGRPRTT